MDAEPVDGWIVIGDFEMLTPEALVLSSRWTCLRNPVASERGRNTPRRRDTGQLDVGRRPEKLGSIWH